MLAYAENAKRQPERQFDLAALKFGDDLAIVGLHGEPFTEIGMAIKKGSPFKQTLVMSFTNAYSGYVPMKECFERGGYEILPIVGGGPAKNTCDIFINKGLELLRFG